MTEKEPKNFKLESQSSNTDELTHETEGIIEEKKLESKNLKEFDKITGAEILPHKWDGIQELNNPVPKWWNAVFWITIWVGIFYLLLYPSWPVDDQKGWLSWTATSVLEEKLDAILNLSNEKSEILGKLSWEEILSDEKLVKFASENGSAIFKDNCATCHGNNGVGNTGGYPNLQDDDWIWGGTVEDIYHTIRHGVRNEDLDDESRSYYMTIFGDILNESEIDIVARYVLSMSNEKFSNLSEEALKQGNNLYTQHCASCHGDNAKGNTGLGVPNLSDAIWLYGGKLEEVKSQIRQPKHGVMPVWGQRLDDNTIKQLAIYVHSLGGGIK